MTKYKNDFFNFLDEHFFTRPKIGFIFIFSFICLLGNRGIWFDSWYNGLFKDKNILYLIPLCLIATTLGRLIEKLAVIRNFDKLITAFGQYLDRFTVESHLKITISQELRHLIEKYPEQFKILVEETEHKSKGVSITSIERKDGMTKSISIIWEFILYADGRMSYTGANYTPLKTCVFKVSTLQKNSYFEYTSEDCRSIERCIYEGIPQSKYYYDNPNIEFSHFDIPLANINHEIFLSFVQDKETLKVFHNNFYSCAITKEVFHSQGNKEIIFQRYMNALKGIKAQDIDNINDITHIKIIHNHNILNKIIEQLREGGLV